MSAIIDVLIIGAGLSGVGMACHLMRSRPKATFRIIERRADMGGTWDLFRYPGVRCDTDMLTMAYSFRPWPSFWMMAHGPSIKRYIEETAGQYGIRDRVSFGFTCVSAHWFGSKRYWEVVTLHEASGESAMVRCRFLVNATGYFNYDRLGHVRAVSGTVPPLPTLPRATCLGTSACASSKMSICSPHCVKAGSAC